MIMPIAGFGSVSRLFQIDDLRLLAAVKGPPAAHGEMGGVCHTSGGIGAARAAAVIRWAHGVAGDARVHRGRRGGWTVRRGRRLHLSQPALTQTVNALERELGVQLLVRSSTGVQPTAAGRTLLTEARAVLTRLDQALAAVAGHTGTGGGLLRLGIPLELPAGLLTGPLAELAAACPATRVEPRHLPTTAQFAALHSGDLDIGLVREHPVGPELDAVLVVAEPLGVLLSADEAAGLAGTDGVRLDAFAAVGAGQAFALAPPNWATPVPATIVWTPLIGNPIVRRTWAAWPASSRRRDLGRLVAALELRA